MESKVHSITDFTDETYKGKIELELTDTEPKGTEGEGELPLSHKEQRGAPCFRTPDGALAQLSPN